MLARPREAVDACGRLFGLQALPDVDHDSEINKLFGVYSKNSNFKYSPQQRTNDIQRILKNNSDHLEAALHLARELLQKDYPEKDLPGKLLSEWLFTSINNHSKLKEFLYFIKIAGSGGFSAILGIPRTEAQLTMA